MKLSYRLSIVAAFAMVLATRTDIAVARQMMRDPAPASAATMLPYAATRDLTYAPSTAAQEDAHKLDLYVPKVRSVPVPVVIFMHGSAWLATNGRKDADILAQHLAGAGYAVAGVAIRSSSQAPFPAQLVDIKNAIRWLRSHAGKYGIDPNRIAVMGESSGGWAAAMAAVTGDDAAFDGLLNPEFKTVSSTVQAAVAFYPPTDFTQMDRWAIRPCDRAVTSTRPGFCHDVAGSPESRLIGCAVEACLDKAAAANPIGYITPADPPILIVHGEADALVPHEQGEALYQALNKACHDAMFVSMPLAPHGVWQQMLSDPSLGAAATVRSTSAAGCTVRLPEPRAPSWRMVIDFLNASLKRK